MHGTAECLNCAAQFTRPPRWSGAMKFCSPRCSNQFSNAKRRNTTPEQFWANVAIGAFGDCWEWTGHRHISGYGHIFWRGRLHKAHRLALSLTDGNWSSRLLVCHTCDNKACCNPAHLYRGTHRDNARDAVNRGLMLGAKGEANRHAKLIASQVLAIRTSDEPTAIVADRFGVCTVTIRQIITRKTWRHLP